MAINVGKLEDLIKSYAFGADKQLLNITLIRELINVRLRELSAQVGTKEMIITQDSVADTQEYELPENVIHIQEVKIQI